MRIGSIAPLATNFVSAVIGGLSQRYPRIRFHLLTAARAILHRELSDRKVNLLIARNSISDERLSFEFLFDDSLVIVASAQSPLARRRRIVLAELLTESWVLPPPESLASSVAMDAFRASGLNCPRATVVTLTPEARISLLANGRLLTIVPASALRLPVKRPDLRVLPVELPMAHVPNGIFTLKDRTLSPVAKLFIEYAREVAKPLAKRKQ